jgi:preprotein translocase subunit SecA
MLKREGFGLKLELFYLIKIPHQVLNAKPENVTRESEIVALAGENLL